MKSDMFLWLFSKDQLFDFGKKLLQTIVFVVLVVCLCVPLSCRLRGWGGGRAELGPGGGGGGLLSLPPDCHCIIRTLCSPISK